MTKQKIQKTLKKLKEIKKQDNSFSNGKIIGSMCTEPHSIAKKTYNEFIETNLGDPKLFSGTKKIEKKYIEFLSKLLHAPNTSDGLIGSGGTESNIVAMWIAKKITRKTKIIVPESAHFSFQKIASLMDINLTTIPLNNKYTTNIKELEKKIDEETAAVVAIAGSTELGTVDDIPKISKICEKNNVFLHVDAAFGGYILPFLKKLDYNVPDFDFLLKGVDSVSIDAHKMGCSAIPLGTLMIRNSDWKETISVKSDCVSTKKQSGILGTRPGASVAAAYAVADYLGMNGYQDIVKKCMNNTFYTEKKVKELGLNCLIKPVTNVIGIHLDKPKSVAKELEKKGWQVNIMDRISCIRLVLMPHVTKKTIDSFIPDLKKVCIDVGEL